MLTPCPGCGREPSSRTAYTCPSCYDPVEDSSALERLQGYSEAEWNERAQDWLDGEYTSAGLRTQIARLDSIVDAGEGQSHHRALSRLLRDELTRRHQECRDTWPPPPSVPREERETARPGR
jgi:hypothetical protein